MDARGSLIEMWDEACRTGMAHTAYGILLDLFSLWEALDKDPEAPVSDEQRAGLREDLMIVLGDEDGTELPAWKELWKCDQVAFEQDALKRIRQLMEK